MENQVSRGWQKLRLDFCPAEGSFVSGQPVRVWLQQGKDTAVFTWLTLVEVNGD